MSLLLNKAAGIRLAVFDVDGVLTDGRLVFSESQGEYKIFDVQDGLGLQLLQQSGVITAIISGRDSPIVTRRAAELGIRYVYQNQSNKLPTLQTLIQHLQLLPEQVAYVGDDLPDIPLLQYVGLPIAVANARPIVAQHAIWQTQASGGRGAAREICEFIMAAQETLETAFSRYLITESA